MTTLRKRISKPHYIFRPSQLIRRATLRGTEPTVETPWGCPLQIAQSDVIGAGIARTGVHELAVSETMWRLTEPEDLAIDVGANIGYFTGLLASRAAKVVAFEPSPQVQGRLIENISRWSRAPRVTVDRRAVSRSNGAATLRLPSGYQANYGIATLEPAEPNIVAHEVQTVRLDEVIDDSVGILKIDVEGHELAVLEGTTLANVRDIFFEEHQPLPTPVSTRLENAGFTIYGIEESLTKPLLVDHAPQSWDAPTYLASRDAARALRLMRPRGWQCLRGRV
jgi:FkbM family methyltransferase